MGLATGLVARLSSCALPSHHAPSTPGQAQGKGGCNSRFFV